MRNKLFVARYINQETVLHNKVFKTLLISIIVLIIFPEN